MMTYCLMIYLYIHLSVMKTKTKWKRKANSCSIIARLPLTDAGTLQGALHIAFPLYTLYINCTARVSATPRLLETVYISNLYILMQIYSSLASTITITNGFIQGLRCTERSKMYIYRIYIPLQLCAFCVLFSICRNIHRTPVTDIRLASFLLIKSVSNIIVSSFIANNTALHEFDFYSFFSIVHLLCMPIVYLNTGPGI